ncbi:ubiquinone/menaquinone biosynthesis methyltransferase [Candidatus Bipolaricaulota bacterium]|nr:ubiquinone/menaquinone biosynthesis methyltransferase [Candidatus Bipolaricaulota bacterium]
MKNKYPAERKSRSTELKGRLRSKDFEGNQEEVREIFKEIAADYDRVNRIISFGQIERWRHRLVSIMDIPEDGIVLDLGCGTGKLTKLVANRIRGGKVVGVDLTPEMIQIARKNLPGEYENVVEFSLGKGEDLVLRSNSFDVVTSAFTLRNVNDLKNVISEMKRIVKPGGKVYSLELAKPTLPGFREIYRFYFNRLLPLIGGVVQGDSKPYRYLADSLKRFPNQKKLKGLYQSAGLVEVHYQEIFGGIAAIHQGTKREN